MKSRLPFNKKTLLAVNFWEDETGFINVPEDCTLLRPPDTSFRWDEEFNTWVTEEPIWDTIPAELDEDGNIVKEAELVKSEDVNLYEPLYSRLEVLTDSIFTLMIRN